MVLLAGGLVLAGSGEQADRQAATISATAME